MRRNILTITLVVVLIASIFPIEMVANTTSKPQKEVLGFYTNTEGVDYSGGQAYEWTSLGSMQKNSKNISMVSPFWFKLDSKGGSKITHETAGLNDPKNAEREMKSIVQKMKKDNMKVLALIHNMLNEKGVSGKKLAHEMLNSVESRAVFINCVENIMVKYGFDGMNIDIENIERADRDNFSKLIKELKNTLGKKGYMITVSVPAKTFDDWNNSYSYPFDYAEIGKYADRVDIMTYDEHGSWDAANPGPIASLPWQEKVIKYAITKMPREKILLGIPAYGFDWGDSKTQPRYQSYRMAIKTASAHNAKILWSDEYSVPYFKYKEGNVWHQVWFESASSFAMKLGLVDKYNLKGIAIWRLGMEDKGFWDIISKKVEVVKGQTHLSFDSKIVYSQKDEIKVNLEQVKDYTNYKIQIINQNGSIMSKDLDDGILITAIPLDAYSDGWYTVRMTGEIDGKEQTLGSKELGINVFADTRNHWAVNEIAQMYKDGYVSGGTNQMFNPGKGITRAEFTVMLARILNLDADSFGYNTKFSDLGSSYWAYNAIVGMEKQGYIGGLVNSKGKNIFAPQQKITRAEMAAILSRIIKARGIMLGSLNTTVFPDIQSHWAKGDIEILSNIGLLKGNADGMFKPNVGATRAEAAVLIHRFKKMVDQ